MTTQDAQSAKDSAKLTHAWLARVAADRDSYATASLYEGALLGVLAAWELIVTGDPTSTLWHKLWRHECAMARVPTLSGAGIADQERELPHLVLAALDPILHEAVPTELSAAAQRVSEYLGRFRIPHADLPAEHVEGFCVEFVGVYQRLRGMEPEQLIAWRLWRTILADTRRPGLTLTQAMSGRVGVAESAVEVNVRIRTAMMRTGIILEAAVGQVSSTPQQFGASQEPQPKFSQN